MCVDYCNVAVDVERCINRPISAVFLALALLRQQATTHAASHTQVLAVRETTATAAIPGTKRVFERFDVLFHHQGDAAGLVWTDKPTWQRAWEPFFVDDFTCTKLELNPSLLPCPLLDMCTASCSPPTADVALTIVESWLCRRIRAPVPDDSRLLRLV